MSVNVLYKTQAKATGGRDGHAATLDGALDVKLTTPKELGGGGGAGNNPEQLFAAGYAACFIGAMKFVASQGGPKVPADASVTSTVGIGPRSEGGFGLDIGLDISLPGLPAPMRKPWSPRRIRCAPTPTPRAAMSMYA
jgi:lipoyl-dependent peroxiredoxin